jgi:predicted AAA+ superfamily ATPase
MDKNIKNENTYSENIKLGGFPPIIYLSFENKKKREFKKIIEEKNINNDINKLNILNIKNILGTK